MIRCPDFYRDTQIVLCLRSICALYPSGPAGRIYRENSIDKRSTESLVCRPYHALKCVDGGLDWLEIVFRILDMTSNCWCG